MALVFMSAHRCELISCRGSVVNIGTHRGRGIKEMQHDGTARALAKKKEKKKKKCINYMERGREGRWRVRRVCVVD